MFLALYLPKGLKEINLSEKGLSGLLKIILLY